MSVFQAQKSVKEHLLKLLSEDNLAKSGFIGYANGTKVFFASKGEAVHLTGGEGYLFEFHVQGENINLQPFT